MSVEDNFIINGTVLERYMGKDEHVVIPEAITEIGEGAFKNNSNLVSVTIPKGVTKIGKAAFWSCKNLISVVINGVTGIGEWAFYSCSSLTNITVPDIAISVESGSFDRCEKLKFNCYDNCLYLGNDDNPYVILIKAKSNQIEKCTIAQSAKSIRQYAFENCICLTEIAIPDGLVSIGKGAFGGCTDLVKVTIPKSVTYVGDSAFAGCNNLTFYCEAESLPESWDKGWNWDDIWGWDDELKQDPRTVFWGAKIIRNA